MEVKLFFDKTAAERCGYTLEAVHQTIKSLFVVHGFPCVPDGDTLIFTDKGHSYDFAVMWNIILSLLRADWFMDCAASCVWQDEDSAEDILAQVGKVGSTMRQ